uniref:ANK_REP_REGION domain-containing protein n=1 Tax=Macrostomum lignano TaxID=282301 RepID=A0A1I8F3C0_9PLAT
MRHRTRIGNQQVRVESSSHSTTVNRAQTQSASPCSTGSVAGPTAVRPDADSHAKAQQCQTICQFVGYSGDHGDDDTFDGDNAGDAAEIDFVAPPASGLRWLVTTPSRPKTRHLRCYRGGETNEALAVVKAEWFRLCCNRPVNEVYRLYGPRWDQGNTSLHYAVSQSNWALVRALLSSGLIRVADLTNKSGYSAPMLVGLCRLPSSTLDSNGEAEDSRSAARDLLASAGDINAKSVPSGRTALMLAAGHGRLESLRLLLQLGADPNLQDDEGFTALMLAAEQGHLDCVRALLAHPNLDVELQNNEGVTALSLALDSGHRDAALQIYARAKLGGRAGNFGLEAELNSFDDGQLAADELSSLLLMEEPIEQQQQSRKCSTKSAEMSAADSVETEETIELVRFHSDVVSQ